MHRLVGMNVVCAWCRREGRHGLIGKREPLDDPGETHGICQRHSAKLLESVPSASFPGVRLLIVVSPSETHLYRYLENSFETVPYVRILMERRRGERRTTRPAGVSADRRRRERRVRVADVSPLGYHFVRFDGSAHGAAATSSPL